MSRFENDLEAALGDAIRSDDRIATEVWCALANVTWLNVQSGEPYSCSWRYAGGLVAELRGKTSADYMDWYACDAAGEVTEYIARRLRKFGWIADTIGPLCDEPGCVRGVSCGTPTEDGLYRMTCSEHVPKKETDVKETV